MESNMPDLAWESRGRTAMQPATAPLLSCVAPRCSAGCVMTEHPVRRAPNGRRATVQDVGVDHRRAHIPVAQQLLNGANVVLYWPPRLSAGRYGVILERRASASGSAPGYFGRDCTLGVRVPWSFRKLSSAEAAEKRGENATATKHGFPSRKIRHGQAR